MQLIRWGNSGLAVSTLAEPNCCVPGMIYLIQDTNFVSNTPAAAAQLSRRRELVQQRRKRITKADIVKMLQARRGAELPRP